MAWDALNELGCLRYRSKKRAEAGLELNIPGGELGSQGTNMWLNFYVLPYLGSCYSRFTNTFPCSYGFDIAYSDYNWW